MKSLLLSTLIALTLAITPAWGVSGNPTAEPSAAKKHNVTKKHKASKKPEAAQTAPVAPAPGIVPQTAATPITIAEPVLPVAPIAATEAAASSSTAQVNMPDAASVTKAMAATTPAPPAVVLVPPLPLLPGNPYLQPILVRPVVANQPPAVVLVPPLPSLPGNPYLQPILVPPVVATQSPADFFPAFAITPSGGLMPTMPVFVPSGVGSGVPTINDIALLTKSLVPTQLSAFLPGDPGASHLPISFSMVHPTGEKPLAVLTIKCPTEALFGVAPPPVKLVHIILTTTMDGINYTGLLPFNLQQVCQ